VPTDTFRNLPEEKQSRIFRAAVREFSEQPFRHASINRIIKEAEIPRGSFYQYFHGKEDLYLYVIGEIGKEKLAAIQAAGAPPPEADFFETMLFMARISLVWAKSQPVYNRIGMLLELDDSELVEKFKAMSHEGIAVIRELIVRDQRRGLIRPDLDPGFLLDIYYSINVKLLSDHYRNGGSDEVLLEKLAAVVDLMRRGAANGHTAS